MVGNFYDMVTVGERGQVVIPARARKELGINPGDKLLVLKGMAKAGLVLLHARHFTRFFKKITRRIEKMRELARE